MGAIWLLSMPQVLRDAGLDVDTYPGWQTRARSTGGYDDILGVQVHHTASFTAPENDMGYMWRNASIAPIGAVYLARNGKVTVGAAGATNTSGRGGPLGPIPQDQANKYVISVEAANAGNGETWTPEQQLVYPILANALVSAYDLEFSVPGLHGHFEWTSRKIDPAGNSRWATGANTWDMNLFRADAKKVSELPPPIVIPPGVPDMFHPIKPFRNSDTRGYGGAGIRGEHTFGLNPKVFPPNVTAVAINVAVVNPRGAGFVTIWPEGNRPAASCLNFSGMPGAQSGSVVVGVKGLAGFKIYLSQTAHVITDVTGFWTP